MGWTVPAAFGLFVAGAAIGLAQLWLRLWEPEAFCRLMLTAGVLLALVLAWGVVQRERRETAAARNKREPG
jgi:hypothetical protein